MGVGWPVGGAVHELTHAGEPFGATRAVPMATAVFVLDAEFQLLILILIFNFHSPILNDPLRHPASVGVRKMKVFLES
jgi:hypothetical protein